VKTKNGFAIHLLCCAFMISLFPTEIFAQLTARAVGMSGAYSALARGVHAPDWNPANLGLPDNPKFSFTVFSIGADVENNSFTQDLYNRYATDEYWDSNEIKDLLSLIPDDGLNANAAASLRLLSFSAGRFAFTMGVDAGCNVRLDKTFFELPLQGNTINTVYDFDNTKANSLGIALLSFSYAHPIEVSFAESFALGGTFHYNGGGYAKSEKAEVSFSTMDYGMDIHADYQGRIGLSQKGWGLDFGAAGQVNKKWTASLCLTNLVSSMQWDKKVQDAMGYVRGDSLDIFDITEEDNKDGKDVLEDSSWTVDGQPFKTRLPVVVRAGCAYQDGPVVLTVDYVQGFEESAWTSAKPRLAFGTEWRGLKWLPLRMGVALGGKTGFGTSLGFGLHPGAFYLDFGIFNRGFILPKTSKGVALAFEMGFGL